MPVNYGLLRGSIIDAIPYQKGADHYQIEVQAAGNIYRIAVDVYSQLAGASKAYSPDHNTVLDTDRMVMYYKDENYAHPVLAAILQSPEGFTPGASLPNPLLLDYLRYDPVLFPLADMKVVPPKASAAAGAGTGGVTGGAGTTSQDDLNDDIDPWVQKAKNNPDAEVFAFGSGWDDSQGGYADPHPYFNPDPSLGVHDIHMNQGDTGSEAQYNGIWQDGALFIRFKAAVAAAGTATAQSAGEVATDQWVAMFFRFQNQSTKTDDKGNPT